MALVPSGGILYPLHNKGYRILGDHAHQTHFDEKSRCLAILTSKSRDIVFVGDPCIPCHKFVLPSHQTEPVPPLLT